MDGFRLASRQGILDSWLRPGGSDLTGPPWRGQSARLNAAYLLMPRRLIFGGMLYLKGAALRGRPSLAEICKASSLVPSQSSQIQAPAAACHAQHGARAACSSDMRALRLAIELGHSGRPASVQHSVRKRSMRSFSYANRVGVALERCPGIPSFGRWRARIEGICVVVRATARNH